MEAATTCLICSRSIRPCTGRTRPAAPPVATARPDYTGQPTPGRYTGPVPIVTHVHGAVGVGDDSDGYAEAWYLPAANNIPAGYATEGTWYDFFAGKAAAGLRCRLGTRLRHLPVPEREPGLDDLVPRPRARDDAPQRLRRPGRLLPHPRRAGRRRRGARQPNRPQGVASRPRAAGERQVPAQQALSGDPDRDPGSLVQRGRVALLPRLARVLRRDRRRLHPGGGVLPDLEPRVLRQHDHGQRQHVAVPRRRAAPLPAPVPQRLPVALPHPRLRPDPRRRGLADRKRGRIPRRPRQPHGRSRQPAAHGPGRTGRRHRRLHQRPRRELRPREPRPRRALRRRRAAGRLRRRRPGHHRPDHAVPRRAGGRASTIRRRRSSSSCPRSRRCRQRR